jgi:hypothetical protein
MVSGGSGPWLLVVIFISRLKLKLSICRAASSLAALLKFATLFVFSNTSASLWRLLKLPGWLADVPRSAPCLYLGLSLLLSGNKDFA